MQDDRLESLEKSLLEMGTEIFRLKHSLSFVASQNDQLNKVLAGLKEILSSKGIISGEDFDEQVALTDAAEIRKGTREFEEFSQEGWKKKSH